MKNMTKRWFESERAEKVAMTSLQLLQEVCAATRRASHARLARLLRSELCVCKKVCLSLPHNRSDGQTLKTS